MRLTLLRHGIPVEPERWSGHESARPLTPAGQAQVLEVVEALKRTGRLEADRVWSSPLTRCQQTARIAAEFLAVPLQISPGLASGADLLLSLPKAHADPAQWPQRLLCVGHSPDLGNLIGVLTGAKTQRFALGRAGSACLTGEFAAGKMKLEWVLGAEEAISLK